MKTYVLIYDGFVQFEVILASYLLKTKGEIITVGIDEDMAISHEGFKTLPHITIDDVVVDEVDAFIIPGGDPTGRYKNDKLYKIIEELNKKNKVLGAICAGPIHLARANALKGKKYTTSFELSKYSDFNNAEYVDENVVIDGNIITAKASGYVDFAIEIGKMMNIYEDDNDLLETIDYFKYFKS